MLEERLDYDSRREHLKKVLIPRYKSDLKQYRENFKNILVNDYHWPVWTAKITARASNFSKKKISLSNILIGAFAAGVPQRYIKPISEIKKTDINIYTNTNIIFDAIGFSTVATSIYFLKDSDVSSNIPNLAKPVYDLLGENLFKPLLYTHVGIKATQIPLRFTYANIKHRHNNWKKKHLPAYSSIVHPLIYPMVISWPIFYYDYKESVKERKLENKSWLYTYLGINSRPGRSN